MDEEFPSMVYVGKYEVEFVDGISRILNIRRTWLGHDGGPMLFVTEDGTIYFARNAISIKPALL